MIDIDKARHESSTTIGVVLPRTLAEAIEQRAKTELIGKSAWMRRVILAELNKNAGAASSPEAA